jgi:hypothetical protein
VLGLPPAPLVSPLGVPGVKPQPYNDTATIVAERPILDMVIFAPRARLGLKLCVGPGADHRPIAQKLHTCGRAELDAESTNLEPTCVLTQRVPLPSRLGADPRLGDLLTKPRPAARGAGGRLSALQNRRR